MNRKLTNGIIAIEVAEHGAEMRSLTREGRQYLWTGDAKFWGRCAPILFPAVGKPFQDEIRVDGTVYPLKQHGFARDCEFKVLAEEKDSIRLQMMESERSQAYPYRLGLEVCYRLEGLTVTAEWTVTNLDDKEAFFQIGAHPGFLLPDFDPESAVNGYVRFYGKNGKLVAPTLFSDLEDGNRIPKDHKVMLLRETPLMARTFIHDALIIEKSQVTLFMELDATDEQLDFPVVYAVGRDGWATYDPEVKTDNLKPLFDTIIKHVPGPADDEEGPLRLLVTMLDYSSYTGRIGIGRITQGKILEGQQVMTGSEKKPMVQRKVVQLMGYKGLQRINIKQARAGDIVAIAGLEGVDVGDTVSSVDFPGVLPTLEIEPPTLSMEFFANDGPFAGRDGKFVTITQIKERLMREQETNVGLKVEEINSGIAGYKVSGRGELHLSVLIESMRREGYELCVSKMVVLTKEENGVKMEPVEYLVMDAPSEYQGNIMTAMGAAEWERM